MIFMPGTCSECYIGIQESCESHLSARFSISRQRRDAIAYNAGIQITKLEESDSIESCSANGTQLSEQNGVAQW
jgi:hypothetical protein